ncbi:MAG: ornithine cyclodeaminase family protein [Bacillota bacterium]
MLVLNRKQVEALLDVGALIDALKPAMVELSAGRVSMPPRVASLVEGKGLLGVMPAYLPASGTLSCKLVSVFPGNGALHLPTHQAVVMLFEAETGVPKAMLDGASITAIRTAAGSALATELLARREAGVVLIVGTGVQARSHATAIRHAIKVREFRVAGRDAKHTEAFAAELARESGLPVKAYAIGAEAFRGADVICACTHAEQPVVKGAWLGEGMHVNSVGLHPLGREVDAEALAKARIVVESRGAAQAPFPSGANELRDMEVHAEIGEILDGRAPGRESPKQITLYKSVGVAVQDAVAAQLVYDAALKQGVGLELPF